MCIGRARFRTAVVIGAVIAVMLVSATTASAAPPRFFRDLRDATWTAHLASDDAGMQGVAWLRKTPCGLGAFFQMTAPCVAGEPTVEQIVLKDEDGNETLLAAIPAELNDFGIVIAYWPTGTDAFPDTPSPMYVQFAPNTFGYDAAYPYPNEPSEAEWMTPAEYIAALDSGDAWVKVLVDGDVVLSGRIVR